MAKKLRSSERYVDILDHRYHEVEEYKHKSKLPTGGYLMGRMLNLLKVPEKGSKVLTQESASEKVADEVSMDWISKNVYPMKQNAVANRILNDYRKLINMSKYGSTCNQIASSNWRKKAEQFNLSMTKNAYDIFSTNAGYRKTLEETYGVKMCRNDIDFYEDNCKGKYVGTCTSTVPAKWKRMKERLEKEKESESKKREEHESKKLELESSRQQQYQEAVSSDIVENDMNNDNYKLTSCPTVEPREYDLRSIDTPRTSRAAYASKGKSRRVPIRTGLKTLNESVVRCTVQCYSEYKVSYNDLVGIMIKTANMIFGQDWSASPNDQELEPELSENDTDVESDEDEDEPRPKKRKSYSGDKLECVFPSHRTIRRYLEDAAFLNLRYVGEFLLNKDANTVITVGLDDTKKAAGRRLYDVKTDHITAISETERKTMTTGYIENISHAGAEGAAAYKHKLEILALLTGSSCDEILEAFDFWMSDRAGDCEKLVEELNIPNDRILKCSAHLILAIDHACDKVYQL